MITKLEMPLMERKTLHPELKTILQINGGELILREVHSKFQRSGFEPQVDSPRTHWLILLEQELLLAVDMHVVTYLG